MLSEINHDFGEGARSKTSNIVAFGKSVKKFLRAQLLDSIDKEFRDPIVKQQLK